MIERIYERNLAMSFFIKLNRAGLILDDSHRTKLELLSPDNVLILRATHLTDEYFKLEFNPNHVYEDKLPPDQANEYYAAVS